MGLKMVASSASGVIGVVLGNPFYLIKNRLQAESVHFKARESHGYSGVVDGLAKVLAKDGPWGFMRGLTAAIPRVVAGSAAQMTSYDYARLFATDTLHLQHGPYITLVASLMSAFVTVTAINPFGKLLHSRL